MLPTNLRITLIIAIIFYFILILIFLKKKALELRYTLLWILAGVVMGFFVVFPQLLLYMIRLLGIESPMNGLYVLCIGFIIIILMALTSIVSKQMVKIRTLVQENAMLEKRLREAEKKVDKYESISDGITDTENL